MNYDFDKLKEPFPEDQIEWRIAQAGKKQNGTVWAKCLAYVTARAIHNRLDEVIGPGNWKNEFTAGPQGGVLCGISLWCDDRKQWVTKWNGGDNTDIEAVKGGLSDAEKRAAVEWGIGRYLYELEDGWAVVSPDGKRSGQFKDKETGRSEWFNWDQPKLPAWALPPNRKKPEGKVVDLKSPGNNSEDMPGKALKNEHSEAGQYKDDIGITEGQTNAPTPVLSVDDKALKIKEEREKVGMSTSDVVKMMMTYLPHRIGQNSKGDPVPKFEAITEPELAALISAIRKFEREIY